MDEVVEGAPLDQLHDDHRARLPAHPLDGHRCPKGTAHKLVVEGHSQAHLRRQRDKPLGGGGVQRLDRHALAGHWVARGKDLRCGPGPQVLVQAQSLEAPAVSMPPRRRTRRRRCRRRHRRCRRRHRRCRRRHRR